MDRMLITLHQTLFMYHANQHGASSRDAALSIRVPRLRSGISKIRHWGIAVGVVWEVLESR